MADVQFNHVYKRYSENSYVIRDLNLQIRDREFLVLVGPSGCGKSTALRMIAGLEDITDGDLYISGKRVNDMAPKDRDIAMVFQNYALYPHMTVYDNMAFSLKLRHLPSTEIAQRVQRAAELLGLDEYLKRKPKQLSGGQRQRVALGRALVREPQVFLLDEPLSNLDAKLRVQTRAEIARLHQQVSVTTVYVTHDQVEAMTMGDRIAVLNGGVIQQLGTPQELYDTPANLFVAGFIGSPSMNFFSAQLVRQDDGAVVELGTSVERHTLPLHGKAADHLSGQATADGRAVIVGIRPEAFRLAGDREATTLTGIVEVVEHLGNEQLVHVRIPGQLLPGLEVKIERADIQTSIARIAPGAPVKPGERIVLAIDTSQLHVFDPVTTNRFM